MDVILLEKVGRLGSVGDKVSVKPGYGRNHLPPKGKAITATASNVAALKPAAPSWKNQLLSVSNRLKLAQPLWLSW